MDNDFLSAIELLLDSKLSNIQNEYLDVQGACFLLGIAKSTLYKLNFSKAIPYFKPSGSKKCYYKRSDLIEYLTKNRFKSKEEIYQQAIKIIKEKKGAANV